MQSTNSFLPHFMITCRVMWVRIARKTCTKPWHFSLCWRWLSSVWPTSGIHVVNNNRVLFQVILCTTELFDSHHHAFTISNTSNYKLLV